MSNVIGFPNGGNASDSELRESEFGYMRALNQRMEKSLNDIMAYEPKVGEKGTLTAYHMKRIAMIGLGK